MPDKIRIGQNNSEIHSRKSQKYPLLTRNDYHCNLLMLTFVIH